MIIPFPYPLNLIIIILLDLIGIYLALWVYWNNKSSKVNRGFSLMVATILAWVNFYYLAQGDNSVFWYRLAATSVFFMLTVYYFFTVRWFLGKGGLYKIFGTFILLYGFIVGILASATDLVIFNSEVINDSLTKPVIIDSGWWLLYSFTIIVTLIINWALIKEYLVYPKENKLKIKYFLVGLLIFAVLNIIFNVFFPAFLDDYRFYEIGNYSVLFFLVFTAYAVVRHKLFDIKILLSQILVLAIWTFVFVRVALSNNVQELIMNSLLLALVFITGILLLKSISKETELTKRLLEETQKSLDLEKKLREKITKKTGEIMKKMEDIVKD